MVSHTVKVNLTKDNDMFCKHDWKELSAIVTKSKFEVATEAMGKHNASSSKLPWQLCNAERKHIQTLTCSKCGKLKRVVPTPGSKYTQPNRINAIDKTIKG